MHRLHPQNGLFRLLDIEVRSSGAWKRVRGDETLLEVFRPGVRYELRVSCPPVGGLGIDGEAVMVPDQFLPLHD
jgi:hypothetical protein